MHASLLLFLTTYSSWFDEEEAEALAAGLPVSALPVLDHVSTLVGRLDDRRPSSPPFPPSFGAHISSPPHLCSWTPSTPRRSRPAVCPGPAGARAAAVRPLPLRPCAGWRGSGRRRGRRRPRKSACLLAWRQCFGRFRLGAVRRFTVERKSRRIDQEFERFFSAEHRSCAYTRWTTERCRRRRKADPEKRRCKREKARQAHIEKLKAEGAWL